MAAAGTEDLAAQWARDLSELAYENIPAGTIEAIKLLILDSLGTALAASTLGDGRDQLKDFIRSQANSDDCSFLGLRGRGSLMTAAFVNGALVHALNYDALGMNGGHVGLAAVPLPLALAEQRRAKGRDLLVAVCAGAEFTCRLATALHRAGVKHENRFLEGQVLGYFGATAAAGRLLGFDPVTMRNAFGFALMQAAGSRQVSIEGGSAKALYGGFPNLGAAVAIAMASNDAGASCSFLEGEAGLYSLCFGGKFERSVLSEGLRDEFLAEKLAFKPWPISSVVQPFVEAALLLQEREKIDPVQIKCITLKVHSRARAWMEPLAERCHPASVATASNSIPFCLAKALANQRLTLEDFTLGAKGIGDQTVATIAQSIEYSLDVDESGKGRLLVELQNSRTVATDVIYECSIPQREDLIRKFTDCAQYASTPLSRSNVQATIDHVMKLESVEDTSVFLELLSGKL
jgi:2-methylcitrate dehydratase PrpD